jgi:hypothetical protein
VPQDIPSASLAKNIPPESESPKVNNPLNPSAQKTLLETPNPPGSVDTNVPTGVASNLTSPPAADWRCDATNQSLRPDPTMHHDASPISSKSFELRAHARPQQGEGSSVPRLGKQPRQYSCVVQSLWYNLDFIQAGFHICQYVLTSVNTQAKQEQIRALYSSMETTFEIINVSFYALSYLLTLRPNLSLIQAVVKHSRDKDQFLRVSLKRMQETQMYETKLKQANEYISALFAQLEELKPN